MRTLGRGLAVALALGAPGLARAEGPDDAAAGDESPLPMDDDALIERQPAGPEETGVEGIPQRAERTRRYKGRVKTDYAEVSAGPGAAYLSRGRVYQNDVVTIIRRNEGGDWLEVESDGLRGWVRAKYLDVVREAAVRGEGPDAVVDAGRDRRETNYTYDDHGRRVRPDGRPVGTGEGAGDDSAAPAPDETDDGFDAPKSPPSGSAGLGLRPHLGLGLGQIRRVFDSDIEQVSPLRHQTAAPMGLALSAGLDWDPLRYLRGSLRFDGVFLGSTDIPRNPELGFDKAVALDVSAWQAGLDAVGRYPVGPAWVGAYAGPRLLRQNYQETQQYPLFLSGTLWSLAFGGAAGVDLPVGFEADVSGGYCLPLSLAQSPADSGTLDAGSGYELNLRLGWRVHRSVSAYGGLFFSRAKLEFSGASSQRQVFDDAADAMDASGTKEPLGYEHARETDTLQGFTLGARGAF